MHLGALVLVRPLPAQVGDLQGIVETEGVSGRDVVAALAVAGATALAAFLVGRLVHRAIGRPGTQSQAVAALAARIVRWAIILVGASWSLSLVGVNLGWFTLAVILLLVAVGLIVRPQIESIGASVVLTTRPAYQIGDEIEVLDQRGEVVDVTSRSTVLRLRDGRRLHVPNTTMLTEPVIVSSTAQPRRSTLELAVEERSDIDALERLVLDALARLSEVLAEPPPRVLARGIRGGAVHLEVRFWHGSRIVEENRARDRAVRAIGAALTAAGIPSAMDQITIFPASAPDDPGVPGPGSAP